MSHDINMSVIQQVKTTTFLSNEYSQKDNELKHAYNMEFVKTATCNYAVAHWHTSTRNGPWGPEFTHARYSWYNLEKGRADLLCWCALLRLL